MAKKVRKQIAVVHGPNLNMLGVREPERYGTLTLAQVESEMLALAPELGVALTFFQSNHEGALVDHIHSLRGSAQGIVINAGGLTHTSVVLRDALLACALPFVEVHLSNTLAREDFRHRSFLSDIALGIVQGFGAESYLLGLRGLVSRL